MLTTLPGFEDLTRDSQQSFRALLTALAEPGKVMDLSSVQVGAPKGMNLACAAACLTLIDFETAVWLQAGFPAAVRDWLRFHAGCSFVESPMEADFAVVSDLQAVSLQQFCWGTAELPESSATLLVQVENLEKGESVVLSGPGILDARTVAPAIPSSFWQAWAENHAAYPRGVDCFLLSEAQVMGLPRSVRAVFSATGG